jgi:hypothetical protein
MSAIWPFLACFILSLFAYIVLIFKDLSFYPVFAHLWLFSLSCWMMLDGHLISYRFLRFFAYRFSGFQ